MEHLRMRLFRKRMETEVRDNILAYWMNHVHDPETRSFIGVVRSPNTPVPEGPRSLVLYARILWTFSAGYRMLGDEAYLRMAEDACAYLLTRFKDPVHGGYYWMLDARGNPIDRKKIVYGNAFVLYALSEYHRATGCPDALREAIAQFLTLDAHAHDPLHGGYLEGFGENWTDLGGYSLGASDHKTEKSMNTHLHVLEAMTNLLRIWEDPRIRNRHREILLAMADHIVDDKEDRFQLYFDKAWTQIGDTTSFGHDIEGSWLLDEAAEVLGEPGIRERIRKLAVRMAERARKTGMDAVHGGMYDEVAHGTLKDGKVWWVQAEAVVGFTNAWQLTGDDTYLEMALDTWLFADSFLVDHDQGEWFGSTEASGTRGKAFTTESDLKAGPWKCPYHNARMCFEMMHRLETAGNRTT